MRIKNKIANINFLDYLPLIMFIAFSFLFTFMLTLGPKLDYDVWFHIRAGEYFFNTGTPPTIPIDSWYALSQEVYWVSHEWLFGVFIYWLMEFSPQLVNLLSTIILSTIVAMVAYYNRKLFIENPSISYIGIIILSFVIKTGNAPRPHLIAYFLTFFLFVILRKDAEEEGNSIFWLLPMTLAWVNLHGGSYILLFLFLFLNIISGFFDFQLGKIVFKKSSRAHQFKRIGVFIVSLVLVGFNAHGIHMYLYPFTNFADNLMQGNITEWAAPDLKVSWQVYLYIAMALYVSALISTKKEIKAIDFLTGFAYIYLTLRSIRFAPQMAIVVMMIVANYTDSIDFAFLRFSKRLILFFSTAMLMISVFSLVPTIATYKEQELFIYSHFPTNELIESIREISPERLYNPYNSGGYLMYKDISVFIDGRADIYTSINLRDGFILNRGGASYLTLIDKYDFDYMLVNKNSTLDALLKANEELFVVVKDDVKFNLYQVIKQNEENN